MKNPSFVRILALAAAIAVVAVCTGGLAHAATYSFTLNNPYQLLGNDNGGGIFSSSLKRIDDGEVLANRSLCGSLTLDVAPGVTYSPVQVYLLSSVPPPAANWDFNYGNKNQVAYLVDHYLTSATTNQQGNALQAAVWKLWLNNGYNYAGKPYASLANDYLAEANQHSDYTSTTAYLVGNFMPSCGKVFQPQFVKIIPEPVFFQMGTLLGLGGLGMFKPRRKRF